jgi:ribosomal protein L14E/L6E/L27E
MNYNGSVAVSLAGRDKGRRFIVVGVLDEDHVLIADGRLRKIEKPKKKKLKHLKVEVSGDDQVADLIKNNLLTNNTAAKMLASYHNIVPNIKKE